MNGDTYAVLRDAVLNQKQVVCNYRGYRREMCPHVLGRNRQGGEQVLSFQFAGESSSGLPLGGEWRCMPVDGITDAQSREGEWHTSHRHTQPQTCVAEIDVEVPY